MIPTTTKVLHRFVPASAKDMPVPPVYLLTVPTKRLRALYDRELTASGVRPFSRGQIIGRIREIVDLLDIDNRDELVGLLDRLEAATEDSPASIDDQRAWRALEMKLQAMDPELQQMQAGNRYYMQMAPITAARVFIAGWSDREMKFERGADGLVPDALIETIPDVELGEIWGEILTLMRPSENDAKNSASPQRSSPDQTTSPAASSPLTDQPGTSSDSATSETPA